MSNSTKKNYYGHRFHDYIPLNHSKGHIVSILWDIKVSLSRILVATNLHKKMTQSIGIHDYFRVSPIGQSLLLILAHAQYPLKVESSCSIVAWWIMTIDSLTVVLVQCASHTLIHSPWDTHSDNQNKSSLQLGCGALQFYWNAQIH